MNFDLHNKRSTLGIWRIEFISFLLLETLDIWMLKVFKCLSYDWKNIVLLGL